MKTPELSHHAIDVRGLTVYKERQVVLNNLAFSIPDGTVTGLIGPSGSGKTTLMRAIIGSQVIDEGSATVLGEPAGSAVLRSRIGYVTQSPAVYGDLTVEQNVRYFASIIRAPKRTIETVIKAVDLHDQHDQLASTLSGGQRARVSLAIALLGSPEVLVLDEPTVGLDPLLREQLWGLFRKLAQEKGKTLLVSSHVMDEAARCDHLLLLREGKLIATATPQQLKSHTHTNNLEEAFIAVIKESQTKERKI